MPTPPPAAEDEEMSPSTAAETAAAAAAAASTEDQPLNLTIKRSGSEYDEDEIMDMERARGKTHLRFTQSQCSIYQFSKLFRTFY
jgi:hypothetical protein